MAERLEKDYCLEARAKFILVAEYRVLLFVP